MSDNLERYILKDEPSRFTEASLNDLLEHCEALSSSDITIQSNAPIFAEVFGRLRRITHRRLSHTEVGDLLNAIYGPNGTTQLLSGSDLDTHYEFKPNRLQRFRYRVNGTACLVEGHDGIQITLRTIPTLPPELATMHLPQPILENISPEEGIIYVTGATGSGKSTLLAAIIRYLIEQEESHRKILTYESPIEFVYDEVETVSSIVSQTEIPKHLPSFSAGIRNALRRKPRLILVGESRDAETMSASLEAALTGHPVYTTLHTTGVAETMRRLVTTFPSDERHGRTIDIIETIRMCVWQKLVPTTDGKRVALREFLVFDESVRDKLLGVDPEAVTTATRKLVKESGQPMLVDAERYYQSGLIDQKCFNQLRQGFDFIEKGTRG